MTLGILVPQTTDGIPRASQGAGSDKGRSEDEPGLQGLPKEGHERKGRCPPLSRCREVHESTTFTVKGTLGLDPCVNNFNKFRTSPWRGGTRSRTASSARRAESVQTVLSRQLQLSYGTSHRLRNSDRTDMECFCMALTMMLSLDIHLALPFRSSAIFRKGLFSEALPNSRLCEKPLIGNLPPFGRA